MSPNGKVTFKIVTKNAKSNTKQQCLSKDAYEHIHLAY